jgi:hypothetical protein
MKAGFEMVGDNLSNFLSIIAPITARMKHDDEIKYVTLWLCIVIWWEEI